MRFGINVNILSPEYENAKKAGFDYGEAIFMNLATANDTDRAKMTEKLRETELPIDHTNGLLLPEFVLCGTKTSPASKLREYLLRGFDLAAELKVKSSVIGSGVSRSVPEGFDRKTAEIQLSEVLTLIADIAQTFNIALLIEPLNIHETNMINTVAEGYEWITRLGHPNIHLLADSYHMRVENEDYDTLVNYTSQLAHAHIAAAEPGTDKYRAFPRLSNPHNERDFLTALKKIGYSGDLTIEASPEGRDWAIAAEEALQALKEWA